VFVLIRRKSLTPRYSPNWEGNLMKMDPLAGRSLSRQKDIV
jgi:hypothetical protein